MIVAGLMRWRTGGIRNLPRFSVGMGLLNPVSAQRQVKADYAHVKTPNPLHHARPPWPLNNTRR